MLQGIIQNNFENSEDFIVGFADMRNLVQDNDLNYGIVIGRRLDNKVIDQINDGPTLEYHHHYKQVNDQLSKIIHRVEAYLISAGYRCRIVEPSAGKGYSIDEYDPVTLRAPVSHKMIGTRAGLGWIGKTDLFISNKFGARLRLVSLLTDYQLPAVGVPILESKCGSCRACVLSCPAKAANGQPWNIHTDRDQFYDAHKCEKKCNEISRSRLNLDASICGICIAHCPIGM